MTYDEYVIAYEALLTEYLNNWYPTNIPSEVKQMVTAADKLVDFREAYPAYAEKYEAQF